MCAGEFFEGDGVGEDEALCGGCGGASVIVLDDELVDEDYDHNNNDDED